MTLPAAPVSCPACGGAVRREDVLVEEARALCPHCRREIDLAEPASAAAGDRRTPAAGNLACPRCGAAIPDSCVEFSVGLARCSHCTTVLDLSSGRFAEWYRRRLKEKELVRFPPGLRVTQSLGALTVEAPLARDFPLPSEYVKRILLFLSVATLAAILIDELPVLRLAVLAADSAAVFYLLFKLRGRRRFAVRNGAILVGWGGIPLPARRHALGVIGQVFVSHRIEVVEEEGTRSEIIVAYDLRFLGSDGRKGTLASWLAERDHAVFLERWIERRLAIEDRHVDGELS